MTVSGDYEKQLQLTNQRQMSGQNPPSGLSLSLSLCLSSLQNQNQQSAPRLVFIVTCPTPTPIKETFRQHFRKQFPAASTRSCQWRRQSKLNVQFENTKMNPKRDKHRSNTHSRKQFAYRGKRKEKNKQTKKVSSKSQRNIGTA